LRSTGLAESSARTAGANAVSVDVKTSDNNVLRRRNGSAKRIGFLLITIGGKFRGRTAQREIGGAGAKIGVGGEISTV